METNVLNPSIDLIKNFQIGFVASVLTQPFEVLRTSSISQYKNTKGVIGMRRLGKLIANIYNKEGIKGFFRGSGLSILKNGVSCTVFFTGLRNIDNQFKKRVPKKWMYDNPSRAHEYVIKSTLNFLNAGLSKILTTILVSPIMLIKTRFQVIGKAKNTVLNEAKKIYRSSGFRGFYKGLVPTLLRDGSLSGFQYSIYSLLMAKVASIKTEGWLRNIIVPVVGGFSTILAVCMTFPFDNLRVRLQIQDSTPKNTIQIIKYTVINEGVLGLYKGIVPRLLKKGFSGAVLWLIYQNIWSEGTKLKMAQ